MKVNSLLSCTDWNVRDPWNTLDLKFPYSGLKILLLLWCYCPKPWLASSTLTLHLALPVGVVKNFHPRTPRIFLISAVRTSTNLFCPWALLIFPSMSLLRAVFVFFQSQYDRDESPQFHVSFY